MKGQNVFIEFEIIKKSNKNKLYKELDVILATGKKVFVWSKLISPIEMRRFCINTHIDIPEDEKIIHKKAYDMRREGATYESISEETKIPIKQLGWYLANNPNKSWVLDDWVADYYIKDSSAYQKADIVIDCDEKIIEKFRKNGIPGNVIESIL